MRGVRREEQGGGSTMKKYAWGRFRGGENRRRRRRTEAERVWRLYSSQNRSHNRSPLLMIIINHKFMNCYFFSAIVSFLSINNWN